MTKSTKKLHLTKHTLRALSLPQLLEVHSGADLGALGPFGPNPAGFGASGNCELL